MKPYNKENLIIVGKIYSDGSDFPFESLRDLLFDKDKWMIDSAQSAWTNNEPFDFLTEIATSRDFCSDHLFKAIVAVLFVADLHKEAWGKTENEFQCKLFCCLRTAIEEITTLGWKSAITAAIDGGEYVQNSSERENLNNWVNSVFYNTDCVNFKAIFMHLLISAVRKENEFISASVQKLAEEV